VGREHHFVPQFYLRSFSDDGRRIHLLNLAKNLHVPLASIKHQCSKRGIHDFNPAAEGALAQLEGSAAAILRTVIADQSLANLSELDLGHLSLFVLLQRSRTLAAASDHDQLTDWLAKMVLASKADEAGVDLNTVKVRDKYPLAQELGVAASIFPMVLDLSWHLIVNNTAEEFLTSDNPVIVHNQFAEAVSYIGVDGWGCRGIQAFLPISPVLMLLLYDGDVYQLSGQKERKSGLSTESVVSLNKFQMLNASSNVYFRDGGIADVVRCRAPHIDADRKKPRVRFVRTKPVARGNDTYSELISHYRPLLPASLILNCVAIRKPWRFMPVAKRAPLWRHPPYRPVDPEPGMEFIEYEVRSDGPADWHPPDLSRTS
jgi:hypothetical protein